jgi:hypothetical protein
MDQDQPSRSGFPIVPDFGHSGFFPVLPAFRSFWLFSSHSAGYSPVVLVTLEEAPRTIPFKSYRLLYQVEIKTGFVTKNSMFKWLITINRQGPILVPNDC